MLEGKRGLSKEGRTAKKRIFISDFALRFFSTLLLDLEQFLVL